MTKNFIELKDLPVYDLFSEYIKIFGTDNYSQICLNSIKEDPDNYLLGKGSLYWDSDKSDISTQKISRPKRKLEEDEFTELCSIFKETKFEEVYNELKLRYNLGRVRIMPSLPKTCLTWHYDVNPRIHFVMKTQPGCFMVFEDEVRHLPNATWWRTNTLNYHTAFNGSFDSRIHLVATILN